MTIKLSDFEAGEKFDGDYGDALKDVQERLADVHFKHIIYGIVPYWCSKAGTRPARAGAFGA